MEEKILEAIKNLDKKIDNVNYNLANEIYLTREMIKSTKTELIEKINEAEERLNNRIDNVHEELQSFEKRTEKTFKSIGKAMHDMTESIGKQFEENKNEHELIKRAIGM